MPPGLYSAILPFLLTGDWLSETGGEDCSLTRQGRRQEFLQATDGGPCDLPQTELADDWFSHFMAVIGAAWQIIPAERRRPASLRHLPAPVR